MRLALVNPPWSFEGSIYFGCREPHLPLEFAYAKALLAARGHRAEIFDAQLESLAEAELARRVADFGPDVTVVTTAPSYLFWRCAPPELRVPRSFLRALRPRAGITLAVGPHGSTTPRSTLAKLGVDAVILGECETVLADIADASPARWGDLPGVASRSPEGAFVINGGPQAVDMTRLPALAWPGTVLRRHHHHHHRFDQAPAGPGAEMETSRGCPYHCTFCAKDNYRDDFRRRPLPILLEELDGLIAAGVEYVYFIDEIFLPHRPLLQALVERDVLFGVQTRIDLWSFEMIDLLGEAGCVSVEAGVESLSPEGRDALDKQCRLSTEEITERLIRAKRRVRFVQANLLDSEADAPAEVEAWRAHLKRYGVWANEPVPMFAYPGSPEYGRRWGLPDDQAWERALDDYLERFRHFSDIQEAQPLRLAELEADAR